MLRNLMLSAVPMVLRSPEGDAGGAGGGGGNGGGAPPAGDPDLQKTIPLVEHKKILDEMHASKSQVKDLNTRLEALQNEVKASKTAGAAASGDFKSLYEATKSEKETLQTQHDSFKKNVFSNERLRSLESELKTRGMKDGSEAIMDLVDLEKMPYELTSRGRIIVHGVKELANELETKYQFAFDKGPPPKFNGAGGTGGGNLQDEELTPQYMVELEKKDPVKYKEIFPRYLESYKKRQAKGG